MISINKKKQQHSLRAGRRHNLLIYRRVMDRLWGSTFVLGGMLFTLRAWLWFGKPQLIVNQDSPWLTTGAVVTLAFSLFAFASRNLAYAQAHRDHIRLATPFLQINISYRRIRSAHPIDFNIIFPAKEASWSQRRLLEPFYGMTAIFLELIDYPLSPFLLRFFLAPLMFSRQKPGFVLLVNDWMEFSTEIDTFLGTWLQTRGRRTALNNQHH